MCFFVRRDFFLRPGWVGLFFAVCFQAAISEIGAAPNERWWKGNLHTHTLWSDGDDYPEMVADWYKTHGYHFLAISDHNIVLEGVKWISITNNKGAQAAFDRYLKRFGEKWVKTREREGTNEVRLRTLKEFAPRFNERNRFLLIPGEEITDRYQTRPVHLNATNLRKLIHPQGGDSVLEVMRNNVDAVLAQRRETGQPMIPHLNHPNFGWAITAEDLMQVQGERFFEVYNGHPAVHNFGDTNRPGTERIWDIVLTMRLAQLGFPPMYGVAVDDAHNYHASSVRLSNPGRGWIWVKARRLSAKDIIAAMEAGNFYASSGVRLKEVLRQKHRLSIEVEPEAGVEYVTQFIGTCRGFDSSSRPGIRFEGSPLPVTRRYSEEVGAVLAEVKGTSASYQLEGDELYVRAKVVSTKAKPNPFIEGEVEAAWTQPLLPAAAK